MLRLCSLGLLFTILFAGGANSLTRNEGEWFTIFLDPPDGHNFNTCLLITPQNGVIKFEPRNLSLSTDKYEILENSDCFVNVHNLDKKDEGVWTMTYDHEGVRPRIINLTVNAAEPEEEYQDENLASLSVIRHATRPGMRIDISLDKRSFEEECYVQSPNSELKKAENFKMEGVTIHLQSSNFVSCRITVGPMTQSLLGVWKLCGKSKQNDEMRCQPADIFWNNDYNLDIEWSSATLTKFNHPVNFGGSVLSGVSHNTNIETCNVITPSGEDLVITSDVSYPHIERINPDNRNLCSINFTNIDASSIGSWIIHAKFRRTALQEIRLPLAFFLYNEKQPYDQAYNVTTLPKNRHLVILGRSLEIRVQSLGVVNNCLFVTPTGQSYDLNSSFGPNGVVLKRVDTTPTCQLILSPITKNMLGQWMLIGKFSNGNQFDEKQQTFDVILEDPENPIIDEFRVVENLTELIFDSKLGASHRIAITNAYRVEHESCHLLTPDGLHYALIDGFHVPNVEILEQDGIECGVTVNVESLDMLGQWTLIARATRTSPVTKIERRRPFTIRIEEHSSLGNAITIAEGADLHLSLPNATNMYNTCKLYGPNEEEVTDFQIDQYRYKSCGFIVKNVTHTQSGTWTIVYGTQIIYRASVEVNILVMVEYSVKDMVWTVGNSVNMTIGPEDTVYCTLIDSNSKNIFNGFGPCHIELDSVTMAHAGGWRFWVGVPGTIMFREIIFNVKVIAADTKPVVTSHVSRNGSSVLLTCSVPVENELQACVFRDSTGTLLLSSHGVGQDGFLGDVIRYKSDSESHNCTLRLLNPAREHAGMWRCAVNTEQHTSYAFLAVTRSMMGQRNYETHDRIEPRLRSSALTFGGAEGDAVTLSCSIDANIRYCYYRAPNGTVFNVGPSISSEGFAYVGNGFDSGECGIRFNNLWRNDSGEWSCHVGLVGNPGEQLRAFEVTVYERMKIWHGWQGSSVILSFSLGNRAQLEYCRFVRIDGRGFTSDNVPQDYTLEPLDLHTGHCSLSIPSPSSEDLQPWTVFAKVYGQNGELFMTSTFTSPDPDPIRPPVFMGVLFWSLFGIICLMFILTGVSLIPKKNREWTYKRASLIRNSFRQTPPNQVHTAMTYK